MKSDSYYLDYNATSPLVKPVLDYLAKGDFPFANPASSHKLGKKSKKIIAQSSSKIKSIFGLESFEILYHSGASEGINTIFNLNSDDALFYFGSDHSAVTEVAKSLSSKGIKTHRFKINKDGYFDFDEIIQKINDTNVSGRKLLNFTFAHNETGVIWDLDLAKKIKESCDIYIHVDAVQSVSKINNFNNLDPFIDAYTFSAHKFGGPKSFGFTLLKDKSSINPLILGGGQQVGLRSGTENPANIEMTAIALDYHLKSSVYSEAIKYREKLESLFESSKHFKVVAKDSKRTCNTIGLICSLDRNDIMLTRFDMSGFYVSRGSACSSGSSLASQTLLDMGHEELAQNFIRVSFSPLMDFNTEELLKDLSQFIHKL